MEVALATIEDLIIAKLEWSELGDSALQRRDTLHLLQAGGDSLDRDHLRKWVTKLGLEHAWARLDASERLASSISG